MSKSNKKKGLKFRDAPTHKHMLYRVTNIHDYFYVEFKRDCLFSFLLPWSVPHMHSKGNAVVDDDTGKHPYFGYYRTIEEAEEYINGHNERYKRTKVYFDIIAHNKTMGGKQPGIYKRSGK